MASSDGPDISNGYSIAHISRIVKDAARTWESYANINFTFVDHQESSDVRILLELIPGSRGIEGKLLIGRYSERQSKNEPTMIFEIGSLAEHTDVRSTALHEWGHSLGMIHEHMSPACSIKWNEEAVLAICGGDRRRACVDYFQVAESETRHSDFDPKSIMIYNIPFRLMKNHVETMRGNDLSDIDKAWAGKFYPSAPAVCQTENPIDQHSFDELSKNFRCSAAICEPQGRQCDRCYEAMIARIQGADTATEY